MRPECEHPRRGSRLRWGRGHRPLPSLSPRDVRRAHRAVARDGSAAVGAAARPRQPRLPVQRPARLRQDDVGAHPRPLPQLRRRPHRHPVRHVPELRRALAAGRRLARRRRDRCGEPQRRRRRPRPARARRVRPRARPLQDLHPRRGAHGDAAGVQRPAEDRGGAARAREVHLRDDGAREGHRHHPLPHAPLSLPARAARAAARLCGRARAQREGRDRAGRSAARRARRRRLGARHALPARPAHRGRRREHGHLRARGRAPRLHARRAPRRGGRRSRRSGCRRRLRRRRPGHPDRPGPAPLRRRPARAAARPHRRAGHARPRRGGSARHSSGRPRAHGRSGPPLRPRRTLACRGRREPCPHRDDRRDLAAPAPRAHDRAPARARRRRVDAWRPRTGRAARTAGRQWGYRWGCLARGRHVSCVGDCWAWRNGLGASRRARSGARPHSPRRVSGSHSGAGACCRGGAAARTGAPRRAAEPRAHRRCLAGRPGPGRVDSPQLVDGRLHGDSRRLRR